MISKCTVLIVTLGLAAGFTIRSDVTRTRRDVPYRGPPAPLNQDGTVAFTSEFLQVNDIHNAAYAEEYQRLQAAAALAAAHPDRSSPPSKDYNPQDNGQYNNHDNGQHAPQQVDVGQYKPHLYESHQQYRTPAQVSHQPKVTYNQGAIQQYTNPAIYKIDPYSPTTQQKQQKYNPQNTQAHVPAPLNTVNYKIDPYTPTTQHNQQQYSAVPQNPQAHIPAPLNPDGTVAQTPEYTALAAALHNTYQQALTRHRRSLNHYQGPPAPLNHDGTVANTPEIENAIAIHKAAYALEYQKLQAAVLQGSNSHYEDDGQYKPHLYDNGEYSSHQEDQHYNHNQYSSSHYGQEPSNNFNPEAHIPAPLNHDGTVAHTAEYKAVANAHQAEFAKALHSFKQQTSSPHFSYSQRKW